MASKKNELRTETDGMGCVQVPSSAYWGARTARALDEESPGRAIVTASTRSHGGRDPEPGPWRLPKRLLVGLALARKAATAANLDLGALDAKIARAIMQSADEIISGQWCDHFPLGLFQQDAIRNLVANLDEVLANRSVDMLGGNLGTYDPVSPDRHLALGLGASECFSIGLKVGLLSSKQSLEQALRELERLVRKKALEFERACKAAGQADSRQRWARLAQQFNAYGSAIERCCRRLGDSVQSLAELSPRAEVAVGDAIQPGADFDTSWAANLVAKLSGYTNVPFRLAEVPYKDFRSTSDYAAVSSALRDLSAELRRLTFDLRSISPAGIPDRVFLLTLKVTANDLSVGLALQAGSIEHDSLLPLISQSLLESFEVLELCVLLLSSRCIASICADEPRQQDVSSQLSQNEITPTAEPSMLGQGTNI